MFDSGRARVAPAMAGWPVAGWQEAQLLPAAEAAAAAAAAAGSWWSGADGKRWHKWTAYQVRDAK